MTPPTYTPLSSKEQNQCHYQGLLLDLLCSPFTNRHMDTAPLGLQARWRGWGAGFCSLGAPLWKLMMLSSIKRLPQLPSLQEALLGGQGERPGAFPAGLVRPVDLHVCVAALDLHKGPEHVGRCINGGGGHGSRVLPPTTLRSPRYSPATALAGEAGTRGHVQGLQERQVRG